MAYVKSRSTLNLQIALFSGAIIATSAFACGGIDESTLFTGGDGGTATSGNDSGNKTDSGTVNKDGGTTVIDSGSKLPPAGGLVQCSSGDCDIASSEVCCYSSDTQTGTCDTSADCNGNNEFPIPCDSTSDCTALGFTGDVCCAQADNTGAVTDVQCKDPTNCRAAQGQTNLCDPGGNDCTTAQTCTASKVSLPGYDICVAN